MSTKLEYTKLPDGYRWNLLNKIHMKIGKWPGTSTTRTKTYLVFVEDLDQADIDAVDAIMASPASACDAIQFTSSGNRLIVKDIWDWRDQIETETGFNIAITYRSSGLKGNAMDEIVLQGTDPTYQAQKLLTQSNKRNFLTAVEGLIRVE